jgi:hypothetical protein
VNQRIPAEQSFLIYGILHELLNEVRSLGNYSMSLYLDSELRDKFSS